MIRETLIPRADWQRKLAELGVNYTIPTSTGEDGVNWDESICYRFTLEQVEQIEAATEALHGLCLAAVDHVVQNPALMDRFGIPQHYRQYIANSWRRYDPYLMGRFDLAYDPATGAVKMLEYNADTPTLVIETAVAQWFWMEEVKEADQFNSLHDKLIERFGEIKAMMPPGEVLYFASLPARDAGDGRAWSMEEFQHATYFRDVAEQAGISTQWININRLGYNYSNGFVGEREEPIRFLHKLYPWEWMTEEAFGKHVVEDRTGFIEPIWKMLLSNKAILPILWSLNPDHPNLLPAFFEREQMAAAGHTDYVMKPILAREGANITMFKAGQPVLTTDGSYGASPKVYQKTAVLPRFGDHRVIIGSWVVGEKAAGMILREDDTDIVVNTSKVVPHYFVD